MGTTSPGCLRPATGRGSASYPQEVQLFAGTIAENIGMGAEDRPGRVSLPPPGSSAPTSSSAACRKATRPCLGERGQGLSLGQRQLLAVARAIVRNPRILILDEATSALDPRAEAHLLANIRRAGKGRTVLLGHRTVRRCSRPATACFSLERGRLVQSGRPAEILAITRARTASAGLQAAG